ncbi:GEM-interacting protein, partial [Colius striatus]
HESLSSLRKSRLQYTQRCEELDRAKQLSAKAEDEYQSSASTNLGSASRQLERRRRSCEDAQAKGTGAGTGASSSPLAWAPQRGLTPLTLSHLCSACGSCRSSTCISDANLRRHELEKVRARIVSHVRKLIYQGDEMLTWVTLRMFKQRQAQSEEIPAGYQHLTEVCKPY